MKRKKAHILSLLLIIIMMVFAVATAPISRPREPDYLFIHGQITYAIDDEYLVIKVNTTDDPNYYVVENGVVEVHFEDRNHPMVFINEISDNGENLSRYVIVAYPREVIMYGDFVFETSVEDNLFVIKIKKEIIRYDNIKILYVSLINQNVDSMARERKEYHYTITK